MFITGGRMAKKIDEVSVKSGRLIKVENIDKKNAANKLYVAVQVEDADGGNERCLLFTENQVLKAQERANKNKEDLTTKGFLADMFD